MAETVRKNLGMVTAYAYAVSKGYSGTEEEFAELMASYADVAQDAEASAQAAAQSATTAEQKATQAAGSAMNAAVSATSASESAQAAAGSSNSASLYAQNASASATNAVGSASSASTYAGNASASAQAAEGSADAAQEFATQAAGSADNAEAAKDLVLGMNAVAETLPAGSQATASYSNGTLTLGVPQGEKGEKGETGESAYDQALEGGYTGSEADFIEDLNSISSLNEDITNLQTDKQDVLTFDQTPTAESTNPVTSAGIKTALDSVDAEIGELKSALNNSNDGKESIKTTFINGSVKTADGTIDMSVLYRVCSQDIISYDYEQEFSVKADFRYILLFYNNSGEYLNEGSGWQIGTYTLPKNQKFRITIARATEDGSETADTDLFASKVSVNTKIAGKIAENTDAIIELESQIADAESGETSIDFTFVNGSINSVTGVIDTSIIYRIATPDIVSFQYNQNIKVNTGYRFMLLYFDDSGNYEHDGSGWVTTNIDVPKGKKFKITIAKLPGTETTNAADIAKFKSNVLIYNETKCKLAQINPIIEYNIKSDGTGDFANLRACLDSITDSSETKKYIVNLYPGEYDIVSLYTAEEISNGYGLFIPDYVTLRGIGNKHNIIIKAILETQNNKWCPINIRHVAEIENLSVTSTNCRYTVHDDWQTRGVYKNIRRIKDCIFTGIRTYYGAVYGSGVKGNADWIFENCVFNGEQADTSGISGACVLLHNNVDIDRGNYVKFINCRFNTTKTSNKYRRGIILGSMTNNAANGTVTITLEGCKVNGISMYENNASEYGAGINMYINGFYNDDAEVMFTVTDGRDYSDHVDLI